MPPSIVVVIVLYETEPLDCVSLNSFLRAASTVGVGELQFEVLLYNNTPKYEFQGAVPPQITYVEDSSNSGLATAYNRALRIAVDKGFTWLLTLDQDTVIPPNGLSDLWEAMTRLADRRDVGAIVPQIRSGGRIVSPNYFRGGVLPTWLQPGYKGIPDHPMFAFNSGSVLRVSALRQAGGYSPWFWLDNSDSNIYRQLFKLGKRVYVAGDVELAHDFSMQNMRQKVSPARYETILLAESAFWDTEMSRLAGLERTARLAVRMIKHLFRNDSAELLQLTWQGLLRRLFYSRRARIERWRRLTAPKVALSSAFESQSRRPRVSVCMAAYNGAAYILEQLESIAPQLGREDEIVIIDDVSSDETVALVKEFQNSLTREPDAPSVLLLQHEQNRGVVPTFEDALRTASGDVLFFSDDDDRWASDKVEKVLKAFDDPKVQLVSTGVNVMDENGNPSPSAAFMRHRKFSAGVVANLLHNQYQGSTLALRSSLLQHILPFPKGRVYLHDAWIGLRTTLSGGTVVHLDEPLLLYRRHGGNFSRRFGRFNQVRLRLQLILDLVRAQFHGF